MSAQIDVELSRTPSHREEACCVFFPCFRISLGKFLLQIDMENTRKKKKTHTHTQLPFWRNFQGCSMDMCLPPLVIGSSVGNRLERCVHLHVPSAKTIGPALTFLEGNSSEEFTVQASWDHLLFKAPSLVGRLASRSVDHDGSSIHFQGARRALPGHHRSVHAEGGRGAGDAVSVWEWKQGGWGSQGVSM